MPPRTSPEPFLVVLPLGHGVGAVVSDEPDTPEGRLRWFSEHGDETWLPSPHFDAAFVLDALDEARHERDEARADLADLRRRVAVLADDMAETDDASDLAAAAVVLLGGVATAVTVLTLTAVLVGTVG